MSISYDLITARVGFRRRKKTRATAWMWKQTPGKWRGPRIREARWTSTSACGCWWWQLFHTVVSLAGLPSTASSSLYRPKLRHNPRSVDNLMNIYCSWSWSQDRRASLSLPPQHHHHHHQLLLMKIEEFGMLPPGDPSACKGRSGSHIITNHLTTFIFHSHLQYLLPTESAFSFPTTTHHFSNPFLRFF